MGHESTRSSWRTVPGSLYDAIGLLARLGKGYLHAPQDWVILPNLRIMGSENWWGLEIPWKNRWECVTLFCWAGPISLRVHQLRFKYQENFKFEKMKRFERRAIRVIPLWLLDHKKPHGISPRWSFVWVGGGGNDDESFVVSFSPRAWYHSAYVSLELPRLERMMNLQPCPSMTPLGALGIYTPPGSLTAQPRKMMLGRWFNITASFWGPSYFQGWTVIFRNSKVRGRFLLIQWLKSQGQPPVWMYPKTMSIMGFQLPISTWCILVDAGFLAIKP